MHITVTLTGEGAVFLQRVRYDLAKFNFPEEVAKVLGVADLALLQPPPGLGLATRETDQQAPDYDVFYSRFECMRQLYDTFVTEVAGPIIGEPYCYQAVPTLRIHYPNNVAVGEFHKDSDYYHPDGELNVWLPLTPAWGSNTLWVEFEPGRVRPVGAVPGDVIVFDAVNTSHGNKVNVTRSTRVSFDFRCLPLSRYRPSDQRSINSGLRFSIGEYYRLPQ